MKPLPWIPALLVVLVTWSLAGISVHRKLEGDGSFCIILASTLWFSNEHACDGSFINSDAISMSTETDSDQHYWYHVGMTL